MQSKFFFSVLACGLICLNAIHSQGIDWGDAPDSPYPTLGANNGAHHMIAPGVQLGYSVDAETDGQPGWSAMGDDLNMDDADGVIFNSWLLPGQNATVRVLGVSGGFLNAWVDFNADGDWIDAGEQIFTDVVLTGGFDHLSFPVPNNIPVGMQTFARFRMSFQSGLNFAGFAPDGEVEDYQLILGTPVMNDMIIDPNPCLTLTQNEISLAMVPGELFDPPALLIAAYNDEPFPGGPALGISYSTDAGATWGNTQLGYPWNPVASIPMAEAFDPSIAADDSGHVFAAYIASDGNWMGGPVTGLFVQKSTDGGITWLPPETVSLEGPPSGSPDSTYRLNDRDQILTDKYLQSPYYNNIYLVWIQDRGWNMPLPYSDVYFSASTDGGSNFSPPKRINSWANGMGNLPVHDVAKNGNIYVAWVDYNVQSGGQGRLYLDKSTDGGLNWGPDALVYTIDLPPLNLNMNTDARAKGAAVLRVLPSDPNTLFVVFAEDPDGNGPDEADIHLIKSTDGGGSWSQPMRINDDNGTCDQVMPWMSIKANDVIDIVWYDRRNDPADLRWDVYFAYSTDGGNSFSTNMQVNTASFLSPYPPKTNDAWIGEYPGLVADYNDAFIGFTTAAHDGLGGDVAFALTPNPEASKDWGDAPDPAFPTLSLNAGASHVCDGATFLGSSCDPEPNAIPDPMAAGDDNYNTDDEDGVIFPGMIIQGATDTIQVEASVSGYLNAWIDYNGNGNWSDAGEHVFADISLNQGSNQLLLTVPANAINDTTFARFRFASYAGLSFNGQATDGEVEDYMLIIHEPTGVGELPPNENEGIRIYPNPFREKINISMEIPSEGRMSIGLFDMEGSCIRQLHASDAVAGTLRLALKINQPAGIYLLQIRLKEEILYTKKVLLYR